MDIDTLKAVILGVIEGVTEFLPVSSTGHLILANEWISFDEEFTKQFDVIIQLGAILAVVVVFWRRLLPQPLRSWKEKLPLWSKIAIATLPGLVIAFVLRDLIDEYLFQWWVVAITLIFWGVILIWIERRQHASTTNTVEQMSWRTALFIGLFQSLALIPGTSRSAMTIIGALLLGVSRPAAVDFSFFLAIPLLSAAAGYSFFKTGLTFTPTELVVLETGFITSFVVAWVVIRYFLNFVRKHDFKVFGYYRIVLGAIVLVYFLLLK
jgi:undecaprenyl-diphosphatase